MRYIENMSIYKKHSNIFTDQMIDYAGKLEFMDCDKVTLNISVQ